MINPYFKFRLIELFAYRLPRKFLRYFQLLSDDDLSMISLLFCKRISSSSAPDLSGDWAFRRATHDDILRLSEHKEGLSLSIYQERLGKGDSCYVLQVDGHPVCFNWINFSSCSIYRGFKKEITFKTLDQHQCFTYDFYTFEKYRGKGFGTAMKKLLFNELDKLKKTEILACVAYGNIESLRIHRKLDYRLITVFYNHRLFNRIVSVQGSSLENYFLKKWFFSSKFNLHD